MGDVPAMPVPVFPGVELNAHFINNHFYQQDHDTVHVVDGDPHFDEDEIEWVLADTHSADTLRDKALEAGRDLDGSPLWIIRTNCGGDLIPGKLSVRERRAYIPFDKKEVHVQNFQVLCAPSYAVCWVQSSRGMVPHGAIIAGHTSTGETLYIGRVGHKGTLTPGKIHPSHRRLYISYAGDEIAHKFYEVLCKME